MTTIAEMIVKAFEEKEHPYEFSRPEIIMEEEHPVFTPVIITNFGTRWAMGVPEEKEIMKDVKQIYNSAILECINTVKDAYSFMQQGSGGTAEYIEKILAHNMVKT